MIWNNCPWNMGFAFHSLQHRCLIGWGGSMKRFPPERILSPWVSTPRPLGIPWTTMTLVRRPITHASFFPNSPSLSLLATWKKSSTAKEEEGIWQEWNDARSNGHISPSCHVLGHRLWCHKAPSKERFNGGGSSHLLHSSSIHAIWFFFLSTFTPAVS